MSHLEDVLAKVHRVVSGVGGPVSLALASHRGVTTINLRNWARDLRRAADLLDETADHYTRKT